MGKIRKLIVSWLLLLCMVFSMAIPVKAAERSSVEDFVTRFYVHILNRQPDSAGLSAWSENLRSGKEQGANVGYGFVQSPEFKKRNLNDEEYIKVLYRAFFDREADGGGLSAWKKVLDSGLSRMHVYKGFAESNEFTKVCARYGITRGNIKLTAPMDKNEGVTKFVARCYKLCLGRRADEDGLNAWCSQILSGANSAKQAAHGFVFSDEFKKKNLSNKEYVKVLYRVFMDREADSAGLNAWVKVLNEGRSRTHVFNGFADSNEFKKICDSYGIYAGEPSPPEVETWKKEYVDKIKAFENEFVGTYANLWFSLYDINEDNTPELILKMHGGGGGSSVSNWIYTIKDGKLYEVTKDCSLGGNLKFYHNDIISLEFHNGTGDFSEEFYTTAGFKIWFLGYIAGNLSDEATYEYYLGNSFLDLRRVNKSEFCKKTGADKGSVEVKEYELQNPKRPITVDNIGSFISR